MATRLIELVETFRPAKIVVAGDFMLDRYLFGSTDRVSPEAPIPVLKFTREEDRLGGAGFVLAALATLGASVSAVGVVGDDAAGRTIAQRLCQYHASTAGLLSVPGRPTVEKVRLLGSSEDRTHQQMIRLDIEETGPIDAATADRLIETLDRTLDGAAVLCLEDYNKGVLTPEVCQRAIALARRRGIPVLIDPARLSDYSKYRGATLLKLNRPETERATGLKVRTPDDCPAAAEHLLTTLDLQAVVLTLNDRGSYLATRAGADSVREDSPKPDGSPQPERSPLPKDSQTQDAGPPETDASETSPGPSGHLLASRPRQVADATGAGDMVIATLCLARASGASWHEAVELANVVGGLEVEKLGCVPITRQEIVQDLLNEQHQRNGKERTLDALLPELERHRQAGRKIVFTNGCFDLVHLGHVKYFQFAKAQGDLLVVGVNTDLSIRNLKGDKRPVVGEDDRIGVLEELESIDYVIRFGEATPLRLIHAIQPNVLVKGADYQKEQVVGWEAVEAAGGRVALAPLIDGRSTSSVIRRILEAYS